MKLRFSLQALEPAVPGRARLYVRDLDEELDLGEYSIAIQRSQNSYYLHSAQSWDASLRWLPQQGWTEHEEGIAVLLNADIVDSLLANASDAYQITLADSTGEELGRSPLKLDKAILPSTAGGNAQAMELTMPAAAAPEPPAPEPVVETPPVVEVVEPVPEPEPVKVDVPAPKKETAAPVAPPAKKGGMAKWIVLLVLLLILAGAAGYWFYSQSAKGDSPAVPDAPESRPAVVETDNCTMDKLSDRPGLQFVQECVKESKTSEQWLAVIEEAKKAEQCDVAQRLYVNKAQSGDVKIAMAYAREYDPKDHQANTCFSKPNPATAAYWYETVLLSEPDNAQAKARFQELSQ
ncbi:hypothetical protein CLH39_14160 [Alcaligenes faecalis]|jgi:hypothetical protein|uniref:hypothetical protein n=1 Tax=Alcaligenes faecalis TaxID=511 RepID=UPI001934500E|nr:hypothetical protein [Alcaligenes faecalis]QRF91296.1 hypothetical protein CLH39_14160 [Alcaligenes faecalis]